jgi:hypothetical protein
MSPSVRRSGVPGMAGTPVTQMNKQYSIRRTGSGRGRRSSSATDSVTEVQVTETTVHPLFADRTHAQTDVQTNNLPVDVAQTDGGVHTDTREHRSGEHRVQVLDPDETSFFRQFQSPSTGTGGTRATTIRPSTSAGTGATTMSPLHSQQNREDVETNTRQSEPIERAEAGRRNESSLRDMPS